MRQGKISENVLKRSVLRKIKTYREEVISGAGIGKDCAILAHKEGMETVLSTTPVTAPLAELGRYAVPMALNNVAVAGAEPLGVLLALLLPEETEEAELAGLMEQVQEICNALHVDILGGHTEVTPVVREPVMTVTGVGHRDAAQAKRLSGVAAGQDIVVSKWIGLEGTARLAKCHREKLSKRFPMRMIEDAADYDRYLSIIPEAATAVKSGVCGMHDVSRGGIFAALWEMASGAGVGLNVHLKKLPVRQETIEICEYFELNPYELLSGGCLLMTAWDGEKLVMDLAGAKIPAVVVGKITDSHDRVLYHGEEKRFLDMPKTDQMYHIFQ
ncbi:hydrogenase maturation factor [bacterium 0.1xD8-71]|nr:hydrogenase maturation factor [bacterium 0.1xD8-71]